VLVVSGFATGGGFTGWIVMVDAYGGLMPSSTVTGITTSPVLSAGGVPVNVLVAGSNVSHGGIDGASGVIVSGSPSGSV
jgi:hypothetical protein